MTSPTNDAFYEARKQLDAAGRGNRDRKDNRPAHGAWPAPPLETSNAAEPLMSRAIGMTNALTQLWEKGTSDPQVMLRVAVTIRAIRMAWGELSDGEVQLDPRWETWLAAWEAGEANSIPLPEGDAA